MGWVVKRVLFINMFNGFSSLFINWFLNVFEYWKNIVYGKYSCMFMIVWWFNSVYIIFMKICVY